MFLKSFNKISQTLLRKNGFIFFTMLAACSLSSIYVKAGESQDFQKEQRTICETNSVKKTYLSQKSIKMYKGKIFVWLNHELFSISTLHSNQRGFYVQGNELGSPLAQIISNKNSQKVSKSIKCQRCGKTFKSYADLYDHLSEVPPCDEKD